MDFSLNEQQEMMQTMARDFLTSEYSDKVLKAMVANEKGFIPELWQKMAATNLTGLSIPEEYGGVGDFLDLVVVLEEMGRACFISPFFSTVVLGAQSIMEAGSDGQKQEYLPAIAEGKLIFTLGITESIDGYSPEKINMKTQKQGRDYMLSGTKLFVTDACVADKIIVASRTGEIDATNNGITLFIIDRDSPGLACKYQPTISGDKLCEVTFDSLRVTEENILGDVGYGWRHLDTVLQKAAIGRCAEMTGMARHVLQLTLDYAKERMAFGHPIGAFQSIQHRCADMLVNLDGSSLVTYNAAWRINEHLPAGKETAIAKAWTGRACRSVMNSAHQVHGAIGFTQDHILHYYTKKAAAADFSFGDSDFHLGKVVI